MRTLGGRFFALAQHDLDPEKEVHVPAVYASFIVKPWITRRTSELNPYNSKYFYWVSFFCTSDLKCHQANSFLFSVQRSTPEHSDHLIRIIPFPLSPRD